MLPSRLGLMEKNSDIVHGISSQIGRDIPSSNRKFPSNLAGTWVYLYLSDIFVSSHTLNRSPFSRRVRNSKGSTHLSAIHALYYGLADWIMTTMHSCTASTLVKRIQANKLFLVLTQSRFRRRKSDTSHFAEKNHPHLTGIGLTSFPPHGVSSPITPPGRRHVGICSLFPDFGFFGSLFITFSWHEGMYNCNYRNQSL